MLLGVLGHDLRNPLSAAQMSAQFLLRSEGLTGAQTKTAARILKSTEKMRGMVDDLLDYTRTSLGLRLPIEPVVSDVGVLCDDVVAELVAVHPDRSLFLETSGDLGGAWDPSRIGQMLSNLVANAVQHSPRDSAVNVSVVGDSEQVIIEVRNEGDPIPDEVRARLFEPLRQTPGPGELSSGSSGLGLGLYIAREIVVAHGGAIDVTSTRAEGTVFTVRLPRRQRVDAAKPTA